MHYHAEVWIPDLKTDVFEQIDLIMESHPYRDWDWWQVGGRYTGVHCVDYDPLLDERNIDICTYCFGSGISSIDDEELTCFYCNGTGNTVKWPTDWVPYDLDTIPVSDIPDNLTCYVIIVNDLIIYNETNKDNNNFVKNELNNLGINSGYMVTIDYHN